MDAGWGMGMAAQWQDSFDTLFRKARQLRESTLQATFTAERLAEEIAAVTRQRQAMDRVDHQVVSWLEADVLADAAGEVELRIDYVVPNALWRPLHTARLLGRNRVQVTSSAAVLAGHRRGLEGRGAALLHGALLAGHRAAPAAGGLLTVKKKNEAVVVQARQVQVQKAGLGSAPASGGARPAAPTSVDLPGVDDGGETRNLKAPGKSTIPSDGRPNVIPLFIFEDGRGGGAGELPGAGAQGVPAGGGAQHRLQPACWRGRWSCCRTTASWGGRRRSSWRRRRSSS